MTPSRKRSVHRSNRDNVDFCGGRRHCSPTGEGSGLGRSISYHMVTRHSGTISLDRWVGEFT